MLVVAVCGLLAGCGAETYERRLEETRKYFAYLEKLDLNLSQPWIGAEIDLRVPKQFQPIEPPKEELDSDGNPVQPALDPRQPDYIDVVLPGLVGAWKTQKPLEVELEARQTKNVHCYMYVLSNREMWTDPALSEAAPEFHKTVTEQLAGALRMAVPEEDKWTVEDYPRRRPPPYVKSKPYRTTTLTPEEPINGVPTDFRLYLHEVGDIKVVVLFVIPHGIDSRQKIPERTRLCLETLNVSSEKPTKGGARAKGKGTAF